MLKLQLLWAYLSLPENSEFFKRRFCFGNLNIKDSTLALQTANLSFLGTGKLLTNAGTTITGANFLNLSQGATLEAAGSLKLDGFSTGSSTILKINADTTITSNSPFTVGSVLLAGNTLTLGSATTDLAMENSAPAGESAGTFKMQEADLTWTGPVKFNTAKVSSTGGTLSLGRWQFTFIFRISGVEQWLYALTKGNSPSQEVS